MTRRLIRAGVAEVGIERPDGPVVEALLSAGMAVCVISRTSCETCVAATDRAATKTTASTRSCWPTPYAPTGWAAGPAP